MGWRDTFYVIFLGVLPGVTLAQDAPVIAPDLAASDLVIGSMTLSTPSEPFDEISALAPGLSPLPMAREDWTLPALAWDGQPDGPGWSLAVMSALRGPGAELMDVVPGDITSWCPGYEAGDRAQRAAFWAGLVSALAWHESSWRPRAVGGGGRWFGLVQIAPGTARWRNCEVRSGQALLDGPANLRCGITIMAATVTRDRVISEGMRGLAVDWGPFHSRRKQEEMQSWVRRQAYCRPPTRPHIRPAGLVPRPVTPLPRPDQGHAVPNAVVD